MDVYDDGTGTTTGTEMTMVWIKCERGLVAETRRWDLVCMER